MSRESVITKVVALLAKADSTEHVPEREAFLAKAQQMITRHQIEDGELAASGASIDEHTILIHDWGNATRGVVHLYAGVAELNRCSVAHRTGRGWSRIVLFGTETDAELTTALIDHLLPQLRAAIITDRPRSRMSYAIGWAHEVIGRLTAASQTAAAESNALVPTNTVAEEALRSAHQLRSERRSTVDAAEFHTGVAAGEQVDLGQRRVDGRTAASAELG